MSFEMVGFAEISSPYRLSERLDRSSLVFCSFVITASWVASHPQMELDKHLPAKGIFSGNWLSRDPGEQWQL